MMHQSSLFGRIGRSFRRRVTAVDRFWQPVASCEGKVSSQHHREYHELAYRQHGDPQTVLQYYKSDRNLLVEPNNVDQTVVAFLAAPWNPADAMVVADSYPMKRSAPGLLLKDGRIPGSEGWGKVVNVSKEDSSYLAVGDFVVPGRPGMGTMRSHCIVPPNDDDSSSPSYEFIKLERGPELFSKCGPLGPAALFQTGGTALRMLQNNFGTTTSIQPGDVVIQNGGNSAVGWMVSQMAASMGAKPVSLVRRGSRSDEQNQTLAQELKTSGKNELVMFEEDLQSTKTALRDTLSDHGLDKPRLALNAIGGSSAKLLIGSLADSGTIVTYGGMSMKPFHASAYQLIFQDIRIVGYWQSRWMTHSSTLEQRRRLMNELVEMVLSGKVVPPPTRVFLLENFVDGLHLDQSAEAIRRKIVLDCREYS